MGNRGRQRRRKRGKNYRRGLNREIKGVLEEGKEEIN